MIDAKRVLDAFPFLGTVPRGSRDAFLSRAIFKDLEHRQMLVSDGASSGYLLLVLSGTLRVFKVSEAGRELTLYRIERGESCVLTATCIMNGGSFPAVAASEGRTQVALAPAALLCRLVEEHAEWRRLVFSLYARRLEIMLTLVEEVAFHHIDARIASELGTSREVVTRILKDFEADGLVSTHRARVEIRSAEALQGRAGHGSVQ